MILRLLRLIHRLMWGQRAVVLFTLILLPVVLNSLRNFMQIGQTLDLTITLGSGLLATLLVASTMKDDRTRNEHQIDEKLDPLKEQLRELSEDHDNTRADYRQLVDDLEEITRWGFMQLGVTPPPRPISLRGKFNIGSPRLS